MVLKLEVFPGMLAAGIQVDDVQLLLRVSSMREAHRQDPTDRGRSRG
jgi:hypothetical protein